MVPWLRLSAPAAVSMSKAIVGARQLLPPLLRLPALLWTHGRRQGWWLQAHRAAAPHHAPTCAA